MQVFFLFSLLIFSSCALFRKDKIVFENDHLKYEIQKDGKNLRFIDKNSGTDYLSGDTLSYFASIMQNNQKFDVTNVTQENNILKLEFGDSQVIAEVEITKKPDHFTVKVLSVKGEAESFTFVNIPLNVEGMSYEPFGACLLAMNLNTHVIQLPALQTRLTAKAYKHTGMEGAMVTMLGLPQEDVLPVIRDVVKNAKDLPFSDKGGAWALNEKEGYGSYLMSGGGRLTEETVDDWIEACKSVGFNQIDNHGGGAFFKFGSFEINEKLYPDGWESFRRINERLHEAGISSILHTYSYFIDKNSFYVTPVPSEELGYFSSFTLAGDIGPEDDEIIVNESTAGVPTVTGFWVQNSVTLRIGDELVEFTGVSKSPPYKFTGCKRGILGTKASAHSSNDKAFHLMELFGRFVPGADTELFVEIAKKTAEIVDECKFDGIYFDAADGSKLFHGDEFYWHYGPRFVFEVMKNLKTPVGAEMAGMTHLWWNYRSRWQAWDSARRGYKRFADIHIASVKSDTQHHGEFSGHLPIIKKLAKVEFSPMLLPLHLGWWRNDVWTPSPQLEMTHTDDIEYLCCKMIGNNAGLSLQGSVDKKSIENTPHLGRLHEIIRQYEELRHKNYFPDSVRELLREQGKDFTLVQEPEGKWNLKPAVYHEHKVTGCQDETKKWTVNNEFDKQPVKMRIQPLMSVRPYNDPSNVVLTDCTSGEFQLSGSADGVNGQISQSDEVPEGAAAAVSFSASSTGEAPKEGTWIKMEKSFDPWIDIDNNQALGVWIKGDGNGQLLNFRIGNPRHISKGRGDHFVDIDFTGWKYFELVEIESTRFSDYIWDVQAGLTTDELDPFTHNVYNSHRGAVNFKNVDRLQLWYNNLPEGKNVNCVIGPVKALPIVPVTISNPSVTIGDETIVFPVTMKSGMWIELMSENNFILYGPNGEVLSDVKVKGSIPELQTGDNEVSFSCDNNTDVNIRVKVTIINEGDPLLK